MSVIAIIIGKERRMVGRLVSAGAVSKESAKTLESVGLHGGLILHRLRERAVIRETTPGHYYVDLESWEAVRHMRRRAASVIGILALILLFLIVFYSKRAHAGTQNDAIDKVFATWNTRESPGCALGVYQNGRIVYERGYGMADLENDVAITPASVFYVGSLSKQFTAMAAALAIQQGKLSADDPIRKYLPELPSYADQITVRHLVHHTSGLRDYNTLFAIAGRRGDEAYDNPTVLRITARQNALNFEPGTEYLYSNTGYTLLAIVVERATKTPFADYADQQIFKPLGMTVSHFHTDSGRLVKGRANAYAVGQGTTRLDTPSNERAGAGGVFTSVRDLLYWDENFYTARVGGKALIEQVQTPGKLKNGNALDYAWGLTIGRYRGAKTVDHGGSLGGYRAHLIRFPEHHTSVAALCNLAIAPSGLVRQVADVVLKDTLKEPRQITTSGSARPTQTTGTAATPTLDAQAQGRYAGKYVSDEIDATFTVAAAGTGLTVQRDTDREPITLQPTGPDTFRARGFTIRFEKSGDRVTSLVVDAGRVRDIRFEKSR
jgi:CubicO group peptidase (beta-lactamase class C family)